MNEKVHACDLRPGDMVVTNSPWEYSIKLIVAIEPAKANVIYQSIVFMEYDSHFRQSFLRHALWGRFALIKVWRCD